MDSELKVIVIAAFAGACAFAAVADEHVGRNLEKGEPARWNEPADTPQKRAEVAMQEAKAALAVADAKLAHIVDTEAAHALRTTR